MEPAVVKEQHLLIIQIKNNICDYMKRAGFLQGWNWRLYQNLMIPTKFTKDYY